MSHDNDRVRLEDLQLENISLVEIEAEAIEPVQPAPEDIQAESPTPKGATLWARAQRTLRSSFAILARPDDTWARSLLSGAEYAVYIGMDARDREHAGRVARALLERHPDASEAVVRAALLHDCGKQLRPYHVLERIWVGLTVAEPDQDALLSSARLAALTSQRPERVGSRKTSSRRAAPDRLSATDVRRFHPQIGAWLIRAAGGDERVALIVEHHHHPGDDTEIAWVHEVDELE